MSDTPRVYRCERCKVQKPATEYGKNGSASKRWSRYGLMTTCKPCQREYLRLWRHRNRAKTRKYGRKDGARRRAVCPKPSRSLTDWIGVLSRDPCSYCGGPGGTIDHVVPVSRGGAVDEGNLAGACRRCNAAKWAHPLLRFLLRSA